MISRADVPDRSKWTHPIPNIEDLMVIENNRTTPNMRIVTIAEFAGNYNVRRVYYGMNRKHDAFLHDIKFSGKSYFENALEPDEIVANACFLYCSLGLCEYQVSKKTFTNKFFSAPQGDSEATSDGFRIGAYNLFSLNCEHFAFACSTDKGLIERCSKEKLKPGTLNHYIRLSSSNISFCLTFESQQLMALSKHTMNGALLISLRKENGIMNSFWVNLEILL